MMAKRKSDVGHELTDKELAKLERRISKVYNDAAKEMSATVNDYFAKFVDRDKEQMAALEAGEITREEYTQWRLTQIGRGNRYRAMRDALAERYTKANEVAIAYVNDDMAKIYAMNRNYTIQSAKEQVDGSLDGINFIQYDESTVKRLLVEEPDLMPYYPKARAVRRGIDLAYGKRKISESVTSGILQGKSIDKIANDLQKNIKTMNRESAIRAARTAGTNAEEAGRQDAGEELESMGCIIEKRWIATDDDRVRPEHLAANGQVVNLHDPFIVGGEELMFPGDSSGSGWNVYACFVGETKVASDSEIVRSYKHEYSGELVKIKTASGVEFTCTLNHPILTPLGWSSANRLNSGDNILVTFVSEVDMLRVNPDIDHVFPSFEALHKFFTKVGIKRTCRLSVNFHGDIPTSDVEIITKERLLGFNRNVSGGKSVNKLLLKHSDKSLVRKGAFMKHFRRVWLSTFGFIRGACKTLSLFWRGLRHSDIHGLRTTTNMDIILPEYSIDDLPTEAMFLGETLDGLSGKVFIDKIISVDISVANTHVYNLQTQNGYYFVNNSIPQNRGKYNGNVFAIAHNCRCSTERKVVGFKSILPESKQGAIKVVD